MERSRIDSNELKATQIDFYVDNKKETAVEEVTKDRRRVESKEQTPDLKSYLVSHKKEVLATAREVALIVKKVLGRGAKEQFAKSSAGAMELVRENDSSNFILYFKDKDDSLAKVTIDLSEIAEFNIYPNNPRELEDKLRELGFRTFLGSQSLFGIDILVVEQCIAENRARVDKIEEEGGGFKF